MLASLSGIFRDSFANCVDLLDDMFERAANADEPEDMNVSKVKTCSGGDSFLPVASLRAVFITTYIQFLFFNF